MNSPESERRLCEKLYHDLGSTIIDCLDNKKIHEIMLNPDGQLWVDSHEEGLLSITRLPSSQVFSIIQEFRAHFFKVVVKSFLNF